eukprot:520672_1
MMCDDNNQRTLHSTSYLSFMELFAYAENNKNINNHNVSIINECTKACSQSNGTNKLNNLIMISLGLCAPFAQLLVDIYFQCVLKYNFTINEFMENSKFLSLLSHNSKQWILIRTHLSQYLKYMYSPIHKNVVYNVFNKHNMGGILYYTKIIHENLYILKGCCQIDVIFVPHSLDSVNDNYFDKLGIIYESNSNNTDIKQIMRHFNEKLHDKFFKRCIILVINNTDVCADNLYIFEPLQNNSVPPEVHNSTEIPYICNTKTYILPNCDLDEYNALCLSFHRHYNPKIQNNTKVTERVYLSYGCFGCRVFKFNLKDILKPFCVENTNEYPMLDWHEQITYNEFSDPQYHLFVNTYFADLNLLKCPHIDIYSKQLYGENKWKHQTCVVYTPKPIDYYQYINQKIGEYYKSMKKEYADQFIHFVVDNEFENYPISEHLGANISINDCVLLDFDVWFPFPENTLNIIDRNKFIFDFLQKCYGLCVSGKLQNAILNVEDCEPKIKEIELITELQSVTQLELEKLLPNNATKNDINITNQDFKSELKLESNMSVSVHDSKSSAQSINHDYTPHPNNNQAPQATDSWIDYFVSDLFESYVNENNFMYVYGGTGHDKSSKPSNNDKQQSNTNATNNNYNGDLGDVGGSQNGSGGSGDGNGRRDKNNDDEKKKEDYIKDNNEEDEDEEDKDEEKDEQQKDERNKINKQMETCLNINAETFTPQLSSSPSLSTPSFSTSSLSTPNQSIPLCTIDEQSLLDSSTTCEYSQSMKLSLQLESITTQMQNIQFFINNVLEPFLNVLNQANPQNEIQWESIQQNKNMIKTQINQYKLFYYQLEQNLNYTQQISEGIEIQKNFQFTAHINTYMLMNDNCGLYASVPMEIGQDPQIVQSRKSKTTETEKISNQDILICAGCTEKSKRNSNLMDENIDLLHRVEELQTKHCQNCNCKNKSNKRKKPKKRKKHLHNIKNISYEPAQSQRARNNINIPKPLTTEYIPQCTAINHKNVYNYMDKSIALQFIDRQIEHSKQDTVCLHLDLFHQTTNKTLYCVIKKKENDKLHKWEMENKLFSEDKLHKDFPTIALPISSRSELSSQFITKNVQEIRHFLNEKTVDDCNWPDIPIFTKKNNQQRMIFSTKKQTMKHKFANFMNTTNINQIELIPIIMFGDSCYWVEYICFIHISQYVQIAIGLQLLANGIKISTIHLDKERLLQQHRIILPQHINGCDCFDKFIPYITGMKIYGCNLDDDENKTKRLSEKYESLKTFL